MKLLGLLFILDLHVGVTFLVVDILNAPETSRLIQEVLEHFGTQASRNQCRDMCNAIFYNNFHGYTCAFACDRIHPLIKKYTYAIPTAVPTAAPTPGPATPGKTK